MPDLESTTVRGQEPAPATDDAEAKVVEPDRDQASDTDDPRITKANREAQRYREELRKAQQRLTEIEDQQKTEQQRALDRAARAEQDAAEARSELLRLKVATELKLPQQLADRLRGGDEDELRADAQALAALFADHRPDQDVDDDDGGGEKPAARLPVVPRGTGKPVNRLTTEEVTRLASENPAEFNRRWEAGEIPAEALA